MAQCHHLIKVEVVIFELDHKFSESVHSHMEQPMPMVVIVKCTSAIANVHVVSELSAKKGLVVVELAMHVEYVVEAQKTVVVLGLHVREDLEVGEPMMTAECVVAAPKVFVVPKLPVETGLVVVEQVESTIALGQQVQEGLELLVDVECAGGIETVC